VRVAVLLFLVGLKLDLQQVRHIGPVALATGLGQLAFTIPFTSAINASWSPWIFPAIRASLWRWPARWPRMPRSSYSTSWTTAWKAPCALPG